MNAGRKEGAIGLLAGSRWFTLIQSRGAVRGYGDVLWSIYRSVGWLIG